MNYSSKFITNVKYNGSIFLIMGNVILFDIDGTLMQEPNTYNEGFVYACKKVMHVDVDMDNFQTSGKTNPEIIRELLSSKKIDNITINKNILKLLNAVESYTLKHLNKNDCRLLPHVHEALSVIKENKIKMGFITGNIESIAFERAKRAGIAHYFNTGGFGSDGEKRSKLVRVAMKRLNSEPENTFVIGDTPKDINAGKEVEAYTIGVASGIFNPEDLSDADLVIDNLGEYNKIIKLVKNASILAHSD